MRDAFRRLRSGCEQARGNEVILRRLNDHLLQRTATVEELVQADSIRLKRRVTGQAERQHEVLTQDRAGMNGVAS